MPKLSIITITYNNLIGLQKTAKSILIQTYQDFEWVIVDGASTDGTKDYLTSIREQWKDHRERLIILSEPDKGVYDAMNKGIDIAKGEYCFFLNAGDVFCSKEVLKRMLEDKVAQAGILYGNEIIVDAEGKRVGYCRGVKNPSFVDIYNSCMKHQATFIPTDLFKKYGRYDTSLRVAADFEWFLRVIGFHDEVVLCYMDVDVSYFENTGISYHSPDLCQKERQQIIQRYLPRCMQQDYTILGRFPRLSKITDQRLPILLLRAANKWIHR